MKKLIVGIIIGIALTLSTSVFASDIKEYMLTKIVYPIMVNGKEYANPDLPALNYKGTTYLPLKAVGEVLGVKVAWNEKMKRVEVGETTAILTIPNATPTPTPSSVPTSIKPEIIKDYLNNSSSPALKYLGVVYLPLRAGAEKYGISISLINWDEAVKTVSFNGSDIHIKLDELGLNSDGFIYNGSSYIREDLFKEAKKQMDQSNSSIDFANIDFDTFKSIFDIGTKSFSGDLIILNVNYNGGLGEKAFNDAWNKMGDKRIEFMAKMMIPELQKNPSYPLTANFISNNARIGFVMASMDSPELAVGHLIDNPFPNLIEIKQ
jgi:hypothetical protein